MNTGKIDITYQELLRLFKDGLTPAEMASQLFVSEATIRRRLHSFGLVYKTASYNIEMYIRMRNVGLNDDKIAYVFGATKKGLINWKYRVGLTKKYKPRGSKSSKDVISNVEDNNIERRN